MTSSIPKRGQLNPLGCAFLPSCLTVPFSVNPPRPRSRVPSTVSSQSAPGFYLSSLQLLPSHDGTVMPSFLPPERRPHILTTHPLSPCGLGLCLCCPISHKITSDHSLVTSNAGSHRRRCFCSFDHLSGGAQHPQLLSPCTSLFSSFSASIAGFSCSTLHQTDKPKGQFSVLFSSLYILRLNLSISYVLRVHGIVSLSTAPKYIYEGYILLGKRDDN